MIRDGEPRAQFRNSIPLTRMTAGVHEPSVISTFDQYARARVETISQ